MSKSFKATTIHQGSIVKGLHQRPIVKGIDQGTFVGISPAAVSASSCSVNGPNPQ